MGVPATEPEAMSRTRTPRVSTETSRRESGVYAVLTQYGLTRQSGNESANDARSRPVEVSQTFSPS